MKYLYTDVKIYSLSVREPLCVCCCVLNGKYFRLIRYTTWTTEKMHKARNMQDSPPVYQFSSPLASSKKAFYSDLIMQISDIETLSHTTIHFVGSKPKMEAIWAFIVCAVSPHIFAWFEGWGMMMIVSSWRFRKLRSSISWSPCKWLFYA